MDRGETVPAALMLRLIADAGMTQADFAKKINQSPQTITNWKARGIPRGELLVVARALKMTVEQYLAESMKPTKKMATKTVRHGAPADPSSIIVPVLDVEGSMGIGRVVQAHEPVVGGLTLSRDWARANLSAVSAYNNLAVISAFGDSMAPTFNDGDILLVDRGVEDVKLDAIYVIGRGDELFVKRIQRRLSGELVIRSDNALFEAETIKGSDLANIRVLGRVVWAWNGHRL